MSLRPPHFDSDMAVLPKTHDLEYGNVPKARKEADPALALKFGKFLLRCDLPQQVFRFIGSNGWPFVGTLIAHAEAQLSAALRDEDEPHPLPLKRATA